MASHNPQLGPTWFLPVGQFGLCHSTCVAETPSITFSGVGRGYKYTPLDLLLGKSKNLGVN